MKAGEIKCERGGGGIYNLTITTEYIPSDSEITDTLVQSLIVDHPIGVDAFSSEAHQDKMKM